VLYLLDELFVVLSHLFLLLFRIVLELLDGSIIKLSFQLANLPLLVLTQILQELINKFIPLIELSQNWSDSQLIKQFVYLCFWIFHFPSFIHSFGSLFQCQFR
jgi:hypothetical protein